MRIYEYIDAHPEVGAPITSLCVIVASVLSHLHLPPLVMELAQVFCWVAGGSAGLVSIYSLIKKKK